MHKSLFVAVLAALITAVGPSAQVSVSPSSLDVTLSVDASTSETVTVTNEGGDAGDLTVRARATSTAGGAGRLFGLPFGDGRSQELLEYDPLTGEITRTVQVAFEEFNESLTYDSMSLAFDGAAVWLVANDASFVRISVEDGSVLDRVDDPLFPPFGVADGLAAGGGELFSAGFGVLVIYDLDTGAIRDIPLPVDGEAPVISYGGARGTIFAGFDTGGGGTVYELDPATGAVLNSFTIDRTPGALAYSAVRGVLLVQDMGGSGDQSVLVLDPDTGAEAAEPLPRVGGEVITADESDAPVWLELSPTALALGAGASAGVAVGLDASGLLQGTYEAVVEVFGAGAAVASVPVTLDVRGRPRLALSAASVAFGEVLVGETAEATLTASNEGTAPLTADLSTTGDAGFAVGTARLELAPGESADVALSYTAAAAGPPAEGQLLLATNDPDNATAAVELRATPVTPPEIDVVPATLSAETEAGDVSQRALIVMNDGDLALRFTARAEQAALAAPVLFVSNGSGEIVPYDPATLEAGTPFPAPRESRSGDALAFDGQALYHVSGDAPRVVSVLDPATGVSPYELPIPDGESAVRGLAFGDGAFFASGLSSEPDVRVFAPDFSAVERRLPLPDGVVFGGDLAFGDGELYLLVQTSSAQRVLVLDAATGATARSFESPGFAGGIAFLDGALLLTAGSDQIVTVDPTTGETLATSSRLETLGPRTLAAAPALVPEVRLEDIATVSGGGSAGFTLTFDATDLVAGTYAGDLVFASNAPATPELRLPFEWTVTGVPNLAVDETEVAFGELYVGAQAARRLRIENDGTADLTVTLDTPDGVEAAPGQLVVAPRAAATVVLTYAPTATGTLAASLRIASDDPDAPAVDVPLSGSATAAPVAALTAPAALDESAAAGDVVRRTVTLRNDGPAPLRYVVAGRLAEAPRPEILTLDAAREAAVRTDAVTGADLGALPLPDAGTPLALAATTDRLYVLYEQGPSEFGLFGKSVRGLDRATGEVVYSRDLGTVPYCGLAASEVALVLVGQNGPQGFATRVDLATGELSAVRYDRAAPFTLGCGVVIDGGEMLLSGYDQETRENGVYRYDLETGAVVGDLIPAGNVRDLALVDGRLFAVRVEGPGVERVVPLDPATGGPSVGPVVPNRVLGGAGPTVGWVALATGTVAPDEAVEVGVVLGAEALEVGTYEADVVVLTDDPAALETVIPTTLEVTGDTPAAAGPPVDAFALGAPYPNPSARGVRLPVSLPAPARVRAEVLDATGRRVLARDLGERAAGTHPLRLDVSALPAGVYTVRVSGGEAVGARRVVVVR